MSRVGLQAATKERVLTGLPGFVSKGKGAGASKEGDATAMRLRRGRHPDSVQAPVIALRRRRTGAGSWGGPSAKLMALHASRFLFTDALPHRGNGPLAVRPPGLGSRSEGGADIGQLARSREGALSLDVHGDVGSTRGSAGSECCRAACR